MLDFAKECGDRTYSHCMWRVSDFRPSEKLFLPRTGEEKITSEQYTHMLNATSNVKKIFFDTSKDFGKN